MWLCRGCATALGSKMQEGDFVYMTLTEAMKITDATAHKPFSQLWGVVFCFFQESSTSGRGTKKACAS
jgi:hypothetical protein